LSLAIVACLVANATAAGPGGWDHLGDGGTPGTSSLNGAVAALDAAAPDALYAGGSFTSAGGNTAAAYIARWDGASWSGIGAPAPSRRARRARRSRGTATSAARSLH